MGMMRIVVNSISGRRSLRKRRTAGVAVFGTRRRDDMSGASATARICGAFIALLVGFICLGQPAPAWAADDGFIRYTTDTAGLSLPLWYAEDKGLFQKHDLKFNDTTVDAAYLGLQEIGAGQNDASIQSDPPTINNIAKGIDAIILAVVSKGNHSMSLVARDSIKSVGDLEGKKVAWLSGSGGELGFIEYLKSKGLSLQNFQHINLQPPEAVPTLVSGGVDAMWFWQPWPRKAIAVSPGTLHIIGTSNANDYEPNMMLTVSRAFAKEKPQTLKRFMSLVVEAVDAVKKDPQACIEIMRKRLRLSPDDAKAALSDYTQNVYLSGDFLKELDKISQVDIQQGVIKSEPDWKKIVDPSVLRAVAPEKVIDFPY